VTASLRPVVAALLLAVCLAACGEPDDEPPADTSDRPALSVPGALSGGSGSGGATEGYLRALEPRDFAFPADHGPHPGFRTEWWYFTGNLEGPDGRRLGYQLTFFRNALAPPEEGGVAGRESAWAADAAWLAHFAVVDGGGGERGTGSFRADERLTRGAAGLAGVELDAGEDGAGRLRVRTEGWSVEPADPADPSAPANPAALAPLRLRAAQPGASIDLRLVALRPPFLHGEPGEAGLSRKGEEPGQASYYYTIPRFETDGTVTVGGEEIAVKGLSWLDREWSTSVLGDDQTGWDWFSLQLSDGSDLMLYRLRRAGGGDDPASSGSVMAADGSGRHLTRHLTRHLAATDFRVEATGEWRSEDGVAYPSGWRLRVPSEDLELTVTPLLSDQELVLPETGLRYWEGAVDARGVRGGRPLTGRGYVELTGYAEEAASKRARGEPPE
jgi:predicted secreted hydrolase